MTGFTNTQFQTLFAYHWHTHQRLLEATGKLSPAALHADPGLGRRSIHFLWVHLLNADRTYRVAMETGRRPPPLDTATLPDLAALQAGFAQEHTAWQEMLDSLSAEAIEGTVTVDFAVPRWHLLQQVILHGMQHHTELAQLLSEHGQSPGDVDFIFFV